MPGEQRIGPCRCSPARAPEGRATPPHPFTSVARATPAGVTALAGPRCHSTPEVGARFNRPLPERAVHEWGQAAVHEWGQAAVHEEGNEYTNRPVGDNPFSQGLSASALQPPAVVRHAARRTTDGRSRGHTRHGRRNPPATATPLHASCRLNARTLERFIAWKPHARAARQTGAAVGTPGTAVGIRLPRLRPSMPRAA